MKADDIKKINDGSKKINDGGSTLHPTEVKSPNQAKGFKEITERMYKVHLDKNKDYSSANVLITGMGGVIVRMWDKIARIYNLMGVPMPNLSSAISEAEKTILDELSFVSNEATINMLKAQDVVKIAFQKLYEAQSIDFSGMKDLKDIDTHNEPLIDSFEDLANYCVIGMLVMQGKWGR